MLFMYSNILWEKLSELVIGRINYTTLSNEKERPLRKYVRVYQDGLYDQDKVTPWEQHTPEMYTSQHVQGVWVHFNVIYMCVILTQGMEQDLPLVKGPLWECTFLELMDLEPRIVTPSMLLI